VITPDLVLPQRRRVAKVARKPFYVGILQTPFSASRRLCGITGFLIASKRSNGVRPSRFRPRLRIFSLGIGIPIRFEISILAIGLAQVGQEFRILRPRRIVMATDGRHHLIGKPEGARHVSTAPGMNEIDVACAAKRVSRAVRPSDPFGRRGTVPLR